MRAVAGRRPTATCCRAPLTRRLVRSSTTSRTPRSSSPAPRWRLAVSRSPRTATTSSPTSATRPNELWPRLSRLLAAVSAFVMLLCLSSHLYDHAASLLIDFGSQGTAAGLDDVFASCSVHLGPHTRTGMGGWGWSTPLQPLEFQHLRFSLVCRAASHWLVMLARDVMARSGNMSCRKPYCRQAPIPRPGPVSLARERHLQLGSIFCVTEPRRDRHKHVSSSSAGSCSTPGRSASAKAIEPSSGASRTLLGTPQAPIRFRRPARRPSPPFFCRTPRLARSLVHPLVVAMAWLRSSKLMGSIQVPVPGLHGAGWLLTSHN